MVDTYIKEKEGNNKGQERFPTEGGEATIIKIWKHCIDW